MDANTRLQFARTAAWTLGPPLAGLLIGTLGFAAALGLNALTFVASAGFIITLSEIRTREPAPPARLVDSFREGIHFLWYEPRLRFVTLAATTINLTFVPMEALFVLFAAQQLAIDSDFLIGWFYAGHALIGTVGVVAAPRLSRSLGLGRVFVLGFFLLGGGFLLLALISPWLAGLPAVGATAIATVPAGIAVAGVSFANVSVVTLRQRLTPEAMLGRVIAASRTLAWAGLPLGAALGGVLGEIVGVRSVYVACSSGILVGAMALLTTSLWRREIPANRSPATPD